MTTKTQEGIKRDEKKESSLKKTMENAECYIRGLVRYPLMYIEPSLTMYDVSKLVAMHFRRGACT